MLPYALEGVFLLGGGMRILLKDILEDPEGLEIIGHNGEPIVCTDAYYMDKEGGDDIYNRAGRRMLWLHVYPQNHEETSVSLGLHPDVTVIGTVEKYLTVDRDRMDEDLEAAAKSPEDIPKRIHELSCEEDWSEQPRAKYLAERLKLILEEGNEDE
jgi:hypothetical protein